MLDRITFTGADDSTDHEGLFALLDAYPLAEAGILLGNHEESPRFPGLAWLNKLPEHCRGRERRRRRLALHLCGRWTEMFLNSRLGADWRLDELLVRHADVFDWVRWQTSRARAHSHLKVSVLFDLSHGAGKQAAKLETPLPGVYCGYAGGFSPENIGENLRQIDALAAQHGTSRYWVDAETWLMSPENHRLSLQRAGQYLEVASEHVNQYVQTEFQRIRSRVST
jgi:hypothetical protein